MDYEIAEFVNRLTANAKLYCNTQQMREHLRVEVLQTINRLKLKRIFEFPTEESNMTVRTMQDCINEIKAEALELAKINLEVEKRREKLEHLQEEFDQFVSQVNVTIGDALSE